MTHRVLVVHNAYQQRGGEDAVVASEVALLRDRGHEVLEWGRHNDDIPGLPRWQVARDTVWSPGTVKGLRAVLARFAPDVVHVHNTFPLVSPSVYWACDQAKVPVVQTLHNFRLHCPQAMYLRDGKVCEDCQGRVPWRGVQRGCYRGSSAQTAVLAAMLVTHRALGTWSRKVTRYIALNEFCRQKFIAGGLPADRIVTKPNFVESPPSPGGDRAGFLFVGRLSQEKGIRVLVDAVRGEPDLRMAVAGSGPEADLLTDCPQIDALGSLVGDAVLARMAGASALVVPSIWFENFPRTIVEAYAAGLPVIASRIGALPEVVKDGVTGLLFNAGDAEDLRRVLRWAQANPQALARMGVQARELYERHYSPDPNYRQMMTIYQDAINARKETP